MIGTAGCQSRPEPFGGRHEARERTVLTAATNMLLRRTVRRWFDLEPDVATVRRKLDAFIGRIDALPHGYSAAPVGQAGGATLHLIAPARGLAADAPLTLYFHGGGYIVGSPASHAAFCARLARQTGGSVLFADYRLAPEHPFPAAFEDGVAALRDAAARAGGRLFIAGDSAGGGLALAVAQAAVAQGLRQPDGLILISPWADLTLSGPSIVANAATDALLSTKILIRMRSAYLGSHDPADRRASPLFDPNIRLPPVLLIYSLAEVLRDDAIRVAAQLRRGGTRVVEAPFKGMPHVFPLFRVLPAARRALREIGKFVAAPV
jgi:acetyl esterase/lipase